MSFYTDLHHLEEQLERFQDTFRGRNPGASPTTSTTRSGGVDTQTSSRSSTVRQQSVPPDLQNASTSRPVSARQTPTQSRTPRQADASAGAPGRERGGFKSYPSGGIGSHGPPGSTPRRTTGLSGPSGYAPPKTTDAGPPQPGAKPSATVTGSRARGGPAAGTTATPGNLRGQKTTGTAHWAQARSGPRAGEQAGRGIRPADWKPPGPPAPRPSAGKTFTAPSAAFRGGGRSPEATPIIQGDQRRTWANPQGTSRKGGSRPPRGADTTGGITAPEAAVRGGRGSVFSPSGLSGTTRGELPRTRGGIDMLHPEREVPGRPQPSGRGLPSGSVRPAPRPGQGPGLNLRPGQPMGPRAGTAGPPLPDSRQPTTPQGEAAIGRIRQAGQSAPRTFFGPGGQYPREIPFASGPRLQQAGPRGTAARMAGADTRIKRDRQAALERIAGGGGGQSTARPPTQGGQTPAPTGGVRWADVPPEVKRAAANAILEAGFPIPGAKARFHPKDMNLFGGR